MKVVPVKDAVGMVLCHDLTRIVPGEGKGAAFRRGHLVRAEDIPLLLSMGKERLYVWEVQPGMLHEEEAAERLARAGAGDGLCRSRPEEGKVILRADRRGLLRVDAAGLEAVNSIGEITVATLRDRTPVTEGQMVAACKVTPLVIPAGQVQEAEAVGPWIEVKPLRPLRAAVIVTGSEVFKGRIADRFGPVVEAKLEAYGCPVIYRTTSDDQAEMTAARIREAVSAGAELILCTGGMSVDPDDATPGAIRLSGAEAVTYGVPAFPGSMTMLGYLSGGIPVMGLPGAVMTEPYTVFDVVLPMLLAGERLTKQDFVRMGHGGLLGR